MGKTMVTSHAGMNGLKKGSNASGYKKLGGGAGKSSSKESKLGGKILHPNSRKAARAHRGVLRADKIAKLKKGSDKKKLAQGEKLLWFQEQIKEGDLAEKTHLSLGEASTLVQAYVNRNVDEMNELKASDEARGRRTNASRIDSIKLMLRQETAEFASGMTLPDFTTVKATRMLREWNLELNTMIAMPTKVFKQSMLEKA